MTKDNFLWCIRNMQTPRLWLRTDGDCWTSAYHITILCYGKGSPARDKHGVAVGSLLSDTFVVCGFQGGDLIATDRNDRCTDRADKALAKYQRWSAEFAKQSEKGT